MTIDALLNHHNSLVREISERAVRYQVLLEKGRITQAEFEVLRGQLVALHGIDEAALSAETRRELQQAVAIVREFLGVVL